MATSVSLRLSPRLDSTKIESDAFASFSPWIGAAGALLEATGFTAAECAYMGDDVIDLPVLRRVGLAIAVPDAPHSVQTHAHYVTGARGGRDGQRPAGGNRGSASRASKPKAPAKTPAPAGKPAHSEPMNCGVLAVVSDPGLRDEIDLILAEITRLQQGLLGLAEAEADTIMPGFTHLQTAQPVTFGHHLLAWFEMLSRDYERLVDCRKRVNRMPLGSAALAGTTYPIAREITAELLGFDAVGGNSLDGVSDRDFAIEFCAAASLAMMHLSRFSEELVLWTSAQFQFIDLPDRFCTGSSIMPQKKNPDVPELVRGKSGRVFGALTGLLTLMKGQPLAYNKDNQEDKEPLFDAADTLRDSLRAFADMVPAIKPKKDIMREAARRGFSTATDLADYLVRKGLPFRDCHEIVGHAVKYGVQTGKDLAEMSLDELRQFSEQIGDDVFAVLTLEGSVNARDHIGGTAPNQVRAAAARGRELLATR